MTTPPIHVRPTAALAERALLPGDPGRALALAQVLLAEPRMFNHHRGLWGYTGAAPDGEPLTIQSTGMGGPSAAIVVEELIALGLRRAVRVGTCAAIDQGLELGAVVVARAALATDGTSRALGAGEHAHADAQLTQALEAAAPQARAGTTASTDLFYAPDARQQLAAWRAAGALAVEMEAATLFTLARRYGIAAACVLAVSDTFAQDGQRRRIDDASLERAGERIGRIAASALGALAG